MSASEFPIVALLYPEVKFWCAVGGAFFWLFKGVEWIKGIKTNDLPHIQAGVDDLKAEMKEGFKEQTEAIVGELRQSREEMRVYFAPMRRRSTARRYARK